MLIRSVLLLATTFATACTDDVAPDVTTDEDLSTVNPTWQRQVVCRNPAWGGRWDALVVDADPTIKLPGGYSPHQAVIRDDMVIDWFESQGLVTRNDPYNHHEAIIPGRGYTGAGFLHFQEQRADGIWVDVGRIGGAWDRMRVRFFYWDPGSCPEWCTSGNTSGACESCTPSQITDIADWIFDQCRYD